MIDRDLAKLYQTPTFYLNKAVKRNADRFPKDFMFQLTKEEYKNLTFQLGMSSFSETFKKTDNSEESPNLTFQIGMSSSSEWGGRRTLPFCFTFAGVAMLSSVLNTEIAIKANVAVMRAFTLLRRGRDLENVSNDGINTHLKKTDQHFNQIFQSINEISRKLVKIEENCLTLTNSVTTLKTKQHKKRGSGKPAYSETCSRSYQIADHVTHSVANHFSLNVRSLLSPKRNSDIVLPRQIAIYLVRHLGKLSYKSIGVYFNDRDHTTILHACRKIEIELQTNEVIRKIVTSLREQIHKNLSIPVLLPALTN